MIIKEYAGYFDIQDDPDKVDEATKKKKNAVDEKKVYEMYYDYEERIKYIKPHRVLAINRGEKEQVLSVSITVDNDYIISYLENKIIKQDNVDSTAIVKNAILDSYKRLILPSIEREVRSELKEASEEAAIEVFGDNLENLILTPPMKEQIVLAFDPGYVNGCKLAVIDKNGKYLDSTVIKPFLNNTTEEKLNQCKKIVVDLINKYKVDIIAIGNGTASRESEKFCSSIFSKGYELVGSVTKNQFMNAWFSSTESDAISTLENSNPRN